jgi:methyl-accepting chemotaxis protein
MHIPKLDSQTILLVLAVVTGLAMFLQVFILLGLSIAMRKAANSIRKEIVSLRSSIMPVIFDTQELLANSRDTLINTQEFIANAQGFLTRVSPRVEAAAVDLVEITKGMRAQTAQVQSSVQEIVERVRKQSSRVDNMVTGVLDTADRAGGFVNDVVAKPVRQVSGILAAIKAIVESLRGSGAQPR